MNPELTDVALKPEKKNFDFVDTIRCISMMGIVLEHCSVVNSPAYSTNVLYTWIETGIIDLFKFCTIAFFLIGGFLINHKFQEYTTKQYLKNRVRGTIRPWLFWMGMYIFLTMLDRYIAYAKGSDSEMVDHFGHYISNLLYSTIFYTSSWFILNFLICISILLIFKRYLYKIWFGGILGVISLIYSVNLYYGWFETKHTTALFGFVFYLWLGVYLNKYYVEIMRFIKKVSWLSMILTVSVFFLLSLLESFKLMDVALGDPYNTLKISNIIFSLVMFALLLKIGNIKLLQAKMQPRSTTFGIYLLHFVIIVRVLPLIFDPLKLHYQEYSVWMNTGILFLRFFIVYSLAFTLSRMIGKTRFKWIVGV